MLSKDIYQYLGDLVDDRTALQMIYLNKNVYGEEYINKILEKRYPYLLKFKSDSETYRKFYAKSIYYISKLKEIFNIDYPEKSKISPQDFYYLTKAYNIFSNQEPEIGSPGVTLNFELNNGYDYSITKYSIADDLLRYSKSLIRDNDIYHPYYTRYKSTIPTLFEIRNDISGFTILNVTIYLHTRRENMKIYQHKF
jgi:hypothetical protein